jgi:short subunit dehydrogenase-like uncharacterized protein
MRYSASVRGMSPSVVIYGATGYSGGLVAREAAARGWSPVLAGRDATKLASLATTLGLEHRVADVRRAEELERAFAGARVVVNAAGPFSRTAAPVAAACLRTRAHYLDLSAEVPAIEALACEHAAARARGVMIMPAVGFDVVATDCLAMHVARRLPSAVGLSIAVTNLRFLSRGSAKTLLEAVDRGLMRRNGELVSVPLGSCERVFEYEAGARKSINVSLADLTTAYHSTGIPNLATYTEGTPVMRALLAAARSAGWMLRSGPAQAWLAACAELLPGDPARGNGDAQPAEGDELVQEVVAEAEDDRGGRASARLRTPEAYAFTPIAAAAVIERVLAGDLEAGFQTPARVYGSELVLTLPGVTREDLQ